MRKALAVALVGLWLVPAAHAASSRILYAGDWTGHTEIFAVDPAGEAPVAQLTHWRGLCAPGPSDAFDLVPSPDARNLAVRCGTTLWLMRADGRNARRLVETGVSRRPAWSRNSRQLVYTLGREVHVFDLATGRDRSPSSRELRLFGWVRDGLVSPNGSWIAREIGDDILILRAKDGAPVTAMLPGGAAAWAPDGNRFAIENRDGISVLDVRSPRLRRLTADVGFGDKPPKYGDEFGLGLAWAPDSRSIAFVPGERTFYGSDATVTTGDLKTITLTNRKRTLVRADIAYGGRISAVAWTKSMPGGRYHRPGATALDRVERNALLADGPIDRLSADSSHVAFTACQRVFLWTPSRKTANGLTGSCTSRDRYGIYEVVVAGDRIGYAELSGCNSIRQQLHLGPINTFPPTAVIATGWGACASAYHPAVGRFIGSGDLLVYSDWQERADYSVSPMRISTLEQSVHDVGPTGCPCPEIASSPGPLIPADVDGDRIVAYGDNETLVLDHAGAQLLTIPVSPRAAQLTKSELVLALQRELRDYDVRTGALLHTWPLPDVWTGPDCGFHCGPNPNCWYGCGSGTLVLEDAARGLVAYVLEKQVHILRLADGADAVVAAGTIARFMDDGLVYADGSRLHLVPFATLPLRAF